MNANPMRTSLALVALVALSACPPALTADPLEKAPRIVAFAASQTLVNAGDSVTLTWNVADATEVTLVESSLGAVSGFEGFEGSLEVSVPGTALYVLTARNARGATVRAVVGIDVREAEGDVLFTATATAIDVGQSVALAWSARGATQVGLVAAPGGAVDVGGQLESGVVTVSPTTSTTYTLTAGSRTASVTVVVRPTILSFAATTDAIDLPDAGVDAGVSLTLAWSTGNAERVRLVAAGRPTLYDSADGGSAATTSFTDALPLPIDPSRLYPYELIVDGAGTTVRSSVSVPVRGSPVVTSLSAPRFVRRGSPVTVSWTTTGADSLALFLGPTELHRTASATAAASGSVEIIAPQATVTLQAVARNSRAGEGRRDLDLEVVDVPSVTLGTIPASPAFGAPFQLTWSGQSVRHVRVVGPRGELLYEEDDTSDTGTVPGVLTADEASTYRIVVDNGIGDYTSAARTVSSPPPFTFAVSPAGSLRAGSSATLSWTGGATVHGLLHGEVSTRTASTGFDDISTSGTRLANGVSSTVSRITTAFRAPFAGRVVGADVSVSTNGYLSFSPVNAGNSVEVPLPSAKLEPLSIAADWDAHSAVTTWWQVKPAGADEVLIVQWVVGSTRAFQVKLFSTGQVDLEYRTMPAVTGVAGLQGAQGEVGVGLTAPRPSGTGFTLVAPKTSPVTVVATSRTPVRGLVRVGSAWAPVAARLDVVQPEELQLSEAMVAPRSTGVAGQWLEFVNTREAPIDLTGWAVTLSDGGVVPLQGSLASKGVRVFGASTDGALNDDAGVDVALAGFALDPARDTFTWGSDAAFGGYSWLSPAAGFAQTFDFGPYRLVGDTASHGVTCVSTQPYGSQMPPQRGTPGQDVTCGFGFGWRRVAPGYHDISRSGTKLVASTTTATQVTFDLSTAPFPFFNVRRNAIRVSADGWLSFDLTAGTNVFSSAAPTTSVPNSVLAIFADDLGGRRPESGVFARRVGQGEDPFAAEPHWIIQWHRWSHVTEDDFNFQVKLFDDGALEYHFAEMHNGPTTTPYGNGSSANTWLENPGGTQALVINASSLSPGISPFTAFRFSPR